jgi:hypothetical protein
MRSELVTQATAPVSNRFLLVHVASALTRKFHRPTKDRMPDSINSSLAGIGEGKYLLTGNMLTLGELDLDWYNGFTGEAQCSYERPEFVAAAVVSYAGIPPSSQRLTGLDSEAETA